MQYIGILNAGLGIRLTVALNITPRRFPVSQKINIKIKNKLK